MILRILQLLLILAVVHAVWRLIVGIMEGAGYRQVEGPTKAEMKLVRDPMCGTYVSPARAPALRIGGQTMYFCSEKCRRQFEKR
jgi:YHS domain-containing protein